MNPRRLPMLTFFLLTFAAADASIAACAPPSPGVVDVVANSYYSDAHHSIVDPAKRAANEAAVKPINDFLQVVTQHAEAYLIGGDPAEAQCALSWLDRWAQDGALLGKMSSNQAHYMRKWTLAGVTLDYLKVKSQATPEQRRHIEAWFAPLADAALAFFDNKKNSRNNHYYWVGLAVMGTGVATGQRKYIDAASTIFDAAINDIADDGSLPMEMERAGKALHYHAYSVGPLVMMAQLSKMIGEDWNTRRDNRLQKLERLVVAGAADPSWFKQKTGVEQDKIGGSSLAWGVFYPEFSPAVRKLGKIHYDARLGGDLVLLADKNIFVAR